MNQYGLIINLNRLKVLPVKNLNPWKHRKHINEKARAFRIWIWVFGFAHGFSGPNPGLFWAAQHKPCDRMPTSCPFFFSLSLIGLSIDRSLFLLSEQAEYLNYFYLHSCTWVTKKLHIVMSRIFFCLNYVHHQRWFIILSLGTFCLVDWT